MSTTIPLARARSVHSTWAATLRTALLATLAVTVVLLAFAWPAYTTKPKDTKVAVVATDAQRPAIEERLAGSGVFVPRAYADRAAAVDAIERREAYGAVVLPDAPTGTTEVLTASAASPAVAQALGAAAQQMGAQQAQAVAAARQDGATKAAALGAQAAAAQASAQTLQEVAQQLAANPATAAQAAAMQPQVEAARTRAQGLVAQVDAARKALDAPVPGVKVTDVVPLSAKDTRGAGLAVAGLPLAMGGMIGGVLISLLVTGWRRRLPAVLTYAVLGGLALTLVLQTWFGFVQGGFLAMWLAIGASLAATATFITGAHALLGQPGIALGAVVTMFVGNPLSSLQMPKEWLPWAWGDIGQFFVPGAAGTLMRDVSYFPRASTWQSWAVIAGWILLGLALTVLGHHNNDEVVHREGATEPDPA